MVSPEEFPSGYVHTLNSQQKDAVDQIWKICEKEYPEVYKFMKDENKNPEGIGFILRFCRAEMTGKKSMGKRFFLVDKTIQRIVKSVEFRRKYQVSEEPVGFEDYKKNIRPNKVWEDSKSRTLVACEKSGQFWMKVNANLYTEEKWKRFFGHQLWLCERRLFRYSSDLGKKDTKGVNVINDINGVGLSVLGKKSLFKILTSIAGQHYPEIANKIFVVNAPYVFSTVWSIAKRFLDSDTVEKVEIHSDIPTKLLCEEFDRSLLPEEYGGESTDTVPVTAADKVSKCPSGNRNM